MTVVDIEANRASLRYTPKELAMRVLWGFGKLLFRLTARPCFGLRGRRLVEENYQWPGIAEKMLAFYEWILNGGDKPDFVV